MNLEKYKKYLESVDTSQFKMFNNLNIKTISHLANKKLHGNVDSYNFLEQSKKLVMSSLDLTLEEQKCVYSRDFGELYSSILECLMFDINYNDHARLWFPQDCGFPYQEAAEDLLFDVAGYPTYPTLDLSFLEITGGNDIIVIPNPMVPLGRWLKMKEEKILIDWLNEYNNRYVIMDTSYSFPNVPGDVAYSLYEHANCISMFTSREMFLDDRSFSFASVPTIYTGTCGIYTKKPNPNDLYHLMGQTPSFPTNLNEEFGDMWMAIEEDILKIDKRWEVPDVGYLSYIKFPFEEVMERGVIGIPASVFGCPFPHTVISCLPSERLKNK